MLQWMRVKKCIDNRVRKWVKGSLGKGYCLSITSISNSLHNIAFDSLDRNVVKRVAVTVPRKWAMEVNC